MTEEDFKGKLEMHIVKSCIQAVQQIIRTSLANCVDLNPYSILSHVGANILIQVITHAHLEEGLDAEKQFTEHFKFIKSSTRKLIIKRKQEDRDQL